MYVFTIDDKHPSFKNEEQEQEVMISAWINLKAEHHVERYLQTIAKLSDELLDFIISNNKSRDNL